MTGAARGATSRDEEPGRALVRRVGVPARTPDDDLDRLFRALSDATRRAVVARLAEGGASVTELAAPFAMSLPAVVQHLAVLERAGVVVSEKTGRVRTYRLARDGTDTAREWLDDLRA
ncbi:ArsR/SmtB family transcription factor [Cellulomonas sp. S1-8]|uniref:ArsR/SmtB family transcription factor n=1 Tax=Cellulomonas sp. S1-8 TaxID=2904790 RepID=UPI002242FB0D|nr:metalloregulator ArsR/SmtB family transcription factor [Cellulomonas sp. S1-8]UZN04276.1 metalloregulator ArsR/SmtB family transcription factor [Cellulomonas sp. S1-8]